jgi:hypothetical protein
LEFASILLRGLEEKFGQERLRKVDSYNTYPVRRKAMGGAPPQQVAKDGAKVNGPNGERQLPDLTGQN